MDPIYEIELEDCPFCGGPGVMQEENGWCVYVECPDCGAHTFPYVECRNNSAQLEHEATTSRIGEDQLFYCLQRGISEDDAISMIVNGFCKDVFSELPLEFAVEAQKLLAISLEHSVG